MFDNSSVEEIYLSFKRNMEGVMSYFNEFGELAANSDVEEVKSYSEYLNTCIAELGLDLNDSEEEIKKKRNKIPKDKFVEFTRKITRRPFISVQNFTILSSGSFLLLNNYFEYLEFPQKTRQVA